MPIYEYKCKKCSINFQVLKSMNEKDKTEQCPKCGSDQTERLISPFITNNMSCNSFKYAGG